MSGSFCRYNYLCDRSYFDSILEAESITFQGTLTAKEKKTTSYYLYFNNIIIDGYDVNPYLTIILVSDSDDIPLRTDALIEAKKVQFNRARNEGNFDEKNYYNSIGAMCKVKGNIAWRSDEGASISEMLYQFRESLKVVYNDTLPGEESGIMTAMCLGDKSGLDTEVKDLFKLSGLAHILAISGLHVSIVGMGLYRLLRRRGVSFVISGIVSIALVILYGLLCGLGVSTLRAIGMFIIMIIADILGQGCDTLSSIGAMLVYVLLMYPYCIDSAGFIFSFGAVTGIAVVVSPLVGVYDKYIRLRFLEKNRGEAFRISIKERLVKALLSGILIQLVTLPIVCFFYYEIPTYVVLLNLIVIPLLGVLLGSTLLGGIIGVIAAVGIFILSNVLSFMCEMLLWVSHIIIYVYELLAYSSLKLPFSRIITGRPSLIEVVIYYVVLVVITRLIVYKSRDMENFIKRDYISFRSNVIAATIGLIVISLFITNNDNRSKFEIDMLDVGQGDGIYVGGGSVNYFFDGGSTSVKNVGTYRILPFLKYKGIRGIEYWFVSHVDEDHISGLVEALDASYPIDYIVVDKYMVGENNYRTIKEKADKNDTNIIIMNKGDIVQGGDCVLRCIFSGDDSIEDINANSLVLLGEYTDDAPVKFLIGGDMTAASEQIIISDNSSEVKNIDILKVAHHGSKTSSSKDFIQCVEPKVSLISAGINNSYGHPHEITLNTLEDACSNIYRTDKNGRILLDLSVKKVLTFW